MGFSIRELVEKEQGNQFLLHETYSNKQLVKMLQTIGFDRNYVRAEGPYLYTSNGDRILDLLSGYGVFAFGRNHPKMKETIRELLELDLPTMVQMDAPLLGGLLAKKLVEISPASLERVFFCNSGTEAIEGAIKFAKAATGRAKIVYCENAFHGLTNGALSLNGCESFREGFSPFLPHCEQVPFNNLEALELALRNKEVAAFVVEPVQGKSLAVAAKNYLIEAQILCKKQGTLLVVDEVQTGFGRTGKMFACEHWGLQPDIMTVAKSLSGGYVPVGAILARGEIFEKVFSRLDRAVVHSSTFSRNSLAMGLGLASIHLIESEKLCEKAAVDGAMLQSAFEGFSKKYEMVQGVEGLGLMLGLKFGPPKSLSLKAGWKLVEAANKGLFCQMITIPLLKNHNMLTQVAGHGSHTVKLLPPLILSSTDLQEVVAAFDSVIKDAHRFPGAVWSLARNLAGNAMHHA